MKTPDGITQHQSNHQRITPMQSDSLMDFLPGIYQTLIRLTILCRASSEWPLASALLRLSLNTNNNPFSLYIYIYIYIYIFRNYTVQRDSQMASLPGTYRTLIPERHRTDIHQVMHTSMLTLCRLMNFGPLSNTICIVRIYITQIQRVVYITITMYIYIY